MKTRIESYSTRRVVVGTVKGTSEPVYDTVANVEITEMRDRGWTVKDIQLSVIEHRFDPTHGYRNTPGHIYQPDIVTHETRATVLFTKGDD